MPAQDAKQDQNNFAGLLVVQGTPGTADTGPGTSLLLRASGDPLTGAVHVKVLGGTLDVGTVATFVDNLDGGTLDLLKAGTITRVEGGSLVVTQGTTIVSSGSIVQTAGTVSTGSLSNVATVGTVLNLNGGSIVVTSGTVVANPTTPTVIVAFRGTVAGAGTPVQLATNAISAGILEAPSTNGGLIYVGGTDVSSTIYGAELQPGQSTGIQIDNTNKIWIDASVSGDICSFIGS